jgi:hypothetical protein
VVDLLTSPFVGYRPAVNPSVVQQVVGRMDHFEDASPELAIAVLTDTAKVQEIEKALSAEDEETVEEAVRAAYGAKARELQDAVAASVQQAADADRQRREAEARAVEAHAARRREQGETENARRQIEHERENWETEKQGFKADVERAERERDAAAGKLEEQVELENRRRRRNGRIVTGIALIALGIVVALVLSLVVVSGRWPVAGGITAGSALSLLGIRVIAGRNWGGEIVTWAGLLVAIAVIIVTIVSGSH